MELLFPTRALIKNTNGSKAELLLEGHSRFSQATLSLVAALIGFAALMVGNFSRFGLWRQILAAIVILILLKSFDNLMADLARSDPKLWPLAYASTGLGLVTLYAILWLAERPTLFRRFYRRQVAA